MTAALQKQNLYDLSKKYEIKNPRTDHILKSFGSYPKESVTNGITLQEIYMYNFDETGKYKGSTSGGSTSGGSTSGGSTSGGGGIIQLPPDFVNQLARAIKIAQQPEEEGEEEGEEEEEEEQQQQQQYITQETINSVNDYINPLRNKTKEDLINEYERIGNLYYGNLDNKTNIVTGKQIGRAHV